MTLGSIIARLADEAFVEEALAGLDDLVLLARLRAAADAAHEPLGSFAAPIVGRFVHGADDERWLALMTAASRARDPATAALRRMLLDALPEAESQPGYPLATSLKRRKVSI